MKTRFSSSGGGVRVAVPPKRWRTALSLCVAAASLFAIGYFGAVFLLFPPQPAARDGIIVPDLAGQSIARAGEQLRPLGLMVGDTISFPHSHTASGVVVAQSPLPGQQIRSGGRVNLGVSAGLPAAAVPDVVGLGVRRAMTLLQRLGFDVEQVLEPSERVEGIVIRTTPSAGRRQTLPAHVQLVVSAPLPDSTRADTIPRDTIH